MRELSCVSDLGLNEWRAGELSPARAAEVEAHLRQCARCRECDADREREHQAFLDAVPSFAALAASLGRPDVNTLVSLPSDAARLPPPVAKRARLRSLGWLGAAMSAAALLVWFGRPEVAPGTRAKGAPQIDFFVKRGARVIRREPEQLLRAGDLLRFTVFSDRPRYLALLDHDPHGARIYYPEGQLAKLQSAGWAVPLDFSVELDDSVGPERIYAVFCPEAFAVEPLRAELARAGELRPPDGCQLDAIEIRKEARP